MGQLDQFAKETFADETEVVTGGGAVWQPMPEIGLSEVRGDGLLIVRDPARLSKLELPWPEAGLHEEVLIELKMQGDHVNACAVERTLLRRQARQVQRMEAVDPPEPPWLGQEPVWLVGSSLPPFLKTFREVHPVSRGCYRIGPSSFSFLWIAANQLPLTEELIPFLVARSGRALVEFGYWINERRPPEWVVRMLQVIPMPQSVRNDISRYIIRSDDPEIRANQRSIMKVVMEEWPDFREEVVTEATEKGRQEGRQEGRQVLAHQCERRLGRPLSAAEHHALGARFVELGLKRVGDAVLDLSPKELEAWLAGSTAP